MPIRVTCRCGKKLKAHDDAAGKRAKCPGCGEMVTLLNAAEPEVPVGVPPETPWFAEPVVPERKRPPALPASKPTAPAGPREALTDLRSALECYSRPIGRMNFTFGLLFLVAIIVGVVSWVFVHFLSCMGIVVVVTVLLLVMAAAIQKPANRRALESVAEIEERYGLSRDESFELLRSDQESAKVQELKEFIIAAWGDAYKKKLNVSAGEVQVAGTPVDTAGRAADEESSRGATPASKFECGECGAMLEVADAGRHVNCGGCKKRLYVPRSPACPKCSSADTVFLARKGKAAALRWGGQLAFGIVGGVIGAAMAAGLSGYHCNDCQHDWALKLRKNLPEN